MGSEEFDDDIFVYGDGPMRQCISGFGANLIDDLDEYTREETGRGISEIPKCKFQWQVSELVRWCRAFNRENHELKAKLAAQESAYANSLTAAPPLDRAVFPGEQG